VSETEPVVVLDSHLVLGEERKRLGLAEQGTDGNAICLSGGGIRSAAFCLGVIQAFAAWRLLGQFHYLSTVSGGGYIGAWLTRCIVAFKGSVEDALDHLNMFKPPAAGAAGLLPDTGSQPIQIDRLRRYTNYLTPSPGIASADTWAGIVLLVRNTLVNWAVFMPLLLAVATVPVLYAAIIAGLGSLQGRTLAVWLYIAIGGLGVWLHYRSVYRACLDLPSHARKHADGDPDEPGIFRGGAQINRAIIVPALAWVFLAPIAFAAVSHLHVPGAEHAARSHIRDVFFRAEPPAARTSPPAGVSNCVVIMVAAPAVPPVAQRCPRPVTLHDKLLLAALPASFLLAALLAFETAASRLGRDAAGDSEAFREGRRAWWIACALAALLLWAGAVLVHRQDPLLLVIIGPLWVLAADALRVIAYVAVRRAGLYGDLDREWLARLSGSKFRTVMGVAIVAAASLLLPIFLIDQISGTWATGTLAAGFLSGPIAAIGGTSALTSFLPGAKPAKGKDGIASRIPLNLITAAFAVVFGLLMLMLLGRLAEILATYLLVTANGHCPPVPAVILVRFGILFLVFSAFVFADWLADCLYQGKPLYPELPDWVLRFILAALLAGTCMIYRALHIDMLQRAFLVIAKAGGEAGQLGRIEDAVVVAALAFAIAVGASVIAIGISNVVNLNHFSMHGVYRNRLVRAFLGPARDLKERQADRFTDFDPRDNIRMADTFPATGARIAEEPEIGHKRRPPRLFPVINVTLNRTSGKDTARAERKGAPFTITPFHCGSPCLRSRPHLPKPDGAYVPTAQYASGKERDRGAHDKRNGISLGTAMAISGAAVSPDMGYSSSPFTAFLMTLFNVRLGAWLPNPGCESGKPRQDETAEETAKRAARLGDLMKRSGPRDAIPTMLQELTGQSDEDGDYIYLSDGGHFDDLGLYEMLRRRNRLIVVVDAGADPKYACFDLGRILGLAAIDLGVRVSFTPPIVAGQKNLSPAGACATIEYAPTEQDQDPKPGTLIYLKPWRPKTLPIELQAYYKSQPEFPHTSTADQFFTESDFEAYRRLGEVLANDMLREASDYLVTDNKALDSLDAFAASARTLAANNKAEAKAKKTKASDAGASS
jgi:hypothetical protein